MSIALSIIDIVKEQAAKAKSKIIKEVELEIGTLAGIEFEALEFAMQAVTRNTMLDNSEIIIKKIEAESQCLDCNKKFEAFNLFNTCPKCKSYNTKLVSGKELRLKSILIE